MITQLDQVAWTGPWIDAGLSMYRPAKATVAKGHIERLPSGSYRVRVYAGTDPVTGKERRLKRTVATEERAALAESSGQRGTGSLRPRPGIGAARATLRQPRPQLG